MIDPTRTPDASRYMRKLWENFTDELVGEELFTMEQTMTYVIGQACREVYGTQYICEAELN